MDVDQDWVKDNIDIIMEEFVRIHPEFKKTDDNTMSAKSREKRKMLDDMDTKQYRPIYYIVKKFPDREKALRQKIKRFVADRDEYKQHCDIWSRKYQAAEDRIIEEFGVKSNEYEIFKGFRDD